MQQFVKWQDLDSDPFDYIIEIKRHTNEFKWCIQQLLPLKYGRTERNGQRRTKRTKWRMWFGRVFNYRIITYQNDDK